MRMIEELLYYLFFAICSGTLIINIFWLIIYFKKRRNLNKPLKNYPPISVIVCAYNEAKTITHVLRSILTAYYPNIDEVIVVNDGSEDNTAGIVKSFNKFVKIINKDHEGKVSALNAGCRAAKNEYIFTVDADTIVCPSSFKRMISYMINNDAGSVSGALDIFSEKKNGLLSVQKYEYITASFSKWLQTILGGAVFGQGSLSCYRKTLLEDVDYFDEDTLTEDLDLTFKLKKIGYDAFHTKETMGITRAPSTISNVFRQRLRWFRGFIQVFWKHKSLILSGDYKKTSGVAALSLISVQLCFLLFFSWVLQINYNIIELAGELDWWFVIHGLNWSELPNTLRNIDFSHWFSVMIRIVNPKTEILTMNVVLWGFAVGMLKLISKERGVSFKEYLLRMPLMMLYVPVLIVAWVTAVTLHLSHRKPSW